MGGITIRAATRADSPLISDFIHGLAAYEKLADQAEATPEKIEESLFGDAPHAEVLIGELDGKPVGFALFFHNFSTFLAKRGLYLEDLFVVPEARGEGVGIALLKELAKIAKDRDCGRMEWWVLDWNTPAVDFYKRLGAEHMEGWDVYRLTGSALNELATRET